MMVLLGVKEDQIETVSFGEEKPRHYQAILHAFLRLVRLAVSLAEVPRKQQGTTLLRESLENRPHDPLSTMGDQLEPA